MMSTKKLIATVAAGIAVAPAVVVYGTTATAAQASSKSPTKAEVAKGKTLFDATCAACHGMKGTGGAGDHNVAYSKLPRAKTIKGVVEQLTKPLLGMPSYDSKYSKKEKEELGAYVTVELTKTVKD